MKKAFLAAALALAVTAAPAGSATTSPERLLVTSDEWNLVLSKTKLEPGPAIVELYNRGEDAHDVRIKRGGASGYVPIPETGAEQSNRIETRFKAGRRYVLWCSLEGHRGLGMEAELRVSRGS
jgi:plastocyanin